MTTTTDADQAVQGSTVGYCSRWPGEPHPWVYTLHAGEPRITTRSCGSCGFLDVTEVREQLAAALAAVDGEADSLTELDRERRRSTKLGRDLRRAQRQRTTIVKERDQAIAEADELRRVLATTVLAEAGVAGIRAATTALAEALADGEPPT